MNTGTVQIHGSQPCYIGTLYSQANIMVKMLKITYVKRQLAHDSENKISFVAYFWTI